MDQHTIFDFRWVESLGDDQPEEHPAKASQQGQDEEAASKAKLEKRQAAYAAKQKRKQERIKGAVQDQPGVSSQADQDQLRGKQEAVPRRP